MFPECLHPDDAYSVVLFSACVFSDTLPPPLLLAASTVGFNVETPPLRQCCRMNDPALCKASAVSGSFMSTNIWKTCTMP
mmetsp:Transcript_15818/g.26704  ORF Transcript_15818/g.26704 Transcript_15818/m.26704 type:complete len:80 (-) Transcript_15818:153-392(-)